MEGNKSKTKTKLNHITGLVRRGGAVAGGVSARQDSPLLSLAQQQHHLLLMLLLMLLLLRSMSLPMLRPRLRLAAGGQKTGTEG